MEVVHEQRKRWRPAASRLSSRAATVLFLLSLGTASSAPAAGDAASASAAPAVLVVSNRQIVEFGAPLFGYAPAERVAVALHRVDVLLQRHGPGKTSVQNVADGRQILLDGAPVFFVAPGDVNPLGEGTLDTTAASAAQALEAAIMQAREQRSLQFLLKAGALALAATLAYAIALRVLFARIAGF